MQLHATDHASAGGVHVTRRRNNLDALERMRPRGVARCHQCGYDHDLQPERAQRWHEQHDASIGECRDADTLERMR